LAESRSIHRTSFLSALAPAPELELNLTPQQAPAPA
jgi:hypothetical protein